MELKLCPTCKTFVFSDMDICYGCMYRFGSDPEREEAVRREIEGSDFPEDVLEEAPALDEAPSSDGGIPLPADRSAPWPPPGDDDAPAVGKQGPAPGTPAAKVVVFAGWNVTLQAEGSWPRGSALQITVEPASEGAGSR